MIGRSPVLVALSTLLGCSSAATSDVCSLEAPTLSSTRLTADGTELRDAAGRLVVLRGADAGERSKLAPFAPFDFPANGYDAALASYLDRAASWGINVLRVPFAWAAVEPTQGSYDPDFLERYDALLDGAWSRGMFTVVDFHQDVYADVYCGDGFPDWTLQGPLPAPHDDCPNWGGEYLSSLPVQKAFDQFWAAGSAVQASYDALWTMMATRYATHAGVIGFEPFNEPGWGTADPDTFEATTLSTFYDGMVARIQAAAPGALVFFDGTGPDSVTLTTQVVRPTGSGVVFAPHYYQSGALGAGMVNAGNVAPALQRWQEKGAAYGVPVFVGEFGAFNATPDIEAYLAAHLDALDGWNGSGTVWEYSVAAEMWNGEDMSLVAADGTENPSAAAIIRPFPRAIAGDAVTFAATSATGAATLSYTPSAAASGATGISEIAMPARLYPQGYTVHVKGGCADSSHPGTLLVQANAGAGTVEIAIMPKE
jgi:endoglycosylceramidase